MHRIVRTTVRLLGLCAFIAGCAPEEPIRIGLIAGLSDRGSDFGESVRNGVILAVEEQNRAGGIRGRKIELLVRDDGQNEAQARQAAAELIALRPEIIIGPVTSSMAAVIVPMMNEARQTLISPTVASSRFFGKDDHFFRVNCTTDEAATQHAQMLWQRGARRVALAFDASNLLFSETWLAAFTQAFERQGGKVSGTRGFASAASTRFSEVIADLLRTAPDAMVFVASSLDTARLAQQARRQASGLPLSSSEWAASGETLSEMGGSAVEGMLITHAYNRDDDGPAFQAFRQAFKQRFQREFGSFSLLAHDTAHLVFTALERRQGKESMKDALLKYGPYQGIQDEIVFNPTGDASRKIYFTEIRNETLVQLK